MNPHAEVGELSSILSACENRVRWLNTRERKLTAIHHHQNVLLFQENDVIRARLLIKNQTLYSFVCFRNAHAKAEFPGAESDPSLWPVNNE